ncbi:rRNA-binding ribosome biosynthesis protein utp25 [Exophiala dermatitidis]|uniref:U3 small nucleolar RNA-associated protein 25 n=1 Tax=Exophiala dermatitidis TaxID=5970 RepID=A0AAN6EWL1_EXODE|nr:rRNA-binding ribosome biosynthesis protein utp25 [Exophiala dermatitidis]KAJ4523978.1 rRNA-binding ribosome biosynthesis protein utp25 [Exophiala dermatitidis]KAJ4525751.1 rRNA-binding ribosome biosynthesis protein utp25 [Exophiala dermatitidis]KAJ4537080.1 rRNA-binding ribosome biosynthesis protein utp25 [Exophiala dermatitidis]KAJ4555324.1 rRNA-binding ribosome biosynthesis protein utp25 [Exophiala dermatitidis]
MPAHRPRRGAKSSGPKRGGGKRGPAPQGRNAFRTSRLNEEEVEPVPDGADGADEPMHSEEEEIVEAEEDAQSASEDETPANFYATLLQSLNPGKEESEPSRKRRKIDARGNRRDEEHTQRRSSVEEVPDNASDDGAEDPQPELNEDVEADEELRDGVAGEADSEDEDALLQDPFEKHYTAVTEQQLKVAARQIDAKEWQTQSSALGGDVRRTILSRNGTLAAVPGIKSPADLFLKRRLLEAGAQLVPSLSSEEKSVAGPLFNYVDVLSGCRTLKNAGKLRDLSCLHALNHVFKTRDRVLKNNARLSAQADGETPDLRDQGFTRPKVLIVVPTKQACVRFVDSIVKLSEPEQQENKSRFLETFSQEDPDEWLDKPEDFRELFGGNHEEDFRIGLKFTRKTIKYFSGFYNSDIIFGSPLGLMRTITTGGGGKKDKKKAHDADFLSSIEVVIVDHANALQMQNWQHVEYVFSQLNLLPKDSHGCDFSRVRHWYLDGQAKYLRQTVIFSDYLTPEINALASTHLHNVAGRVKFVPTYPGAMLSISSLLPFTIHQTFLRIPSPNPLQDSDVRFQFFTTTILPPLVRDSRHQKGVLLFVPTYADFVRLRNHLSTSSDATSLSFGSLSEYTPVRDVMRARSHFLSGRHALLLYSERAHHHFRYRIKGVRKIIFYGVPENPLFWPEIISLLGLASGNGAAAQGAKATEINPKGAVRALFSKWDALKLERIVGTERVGRLLHDRAGDTFDFV